MTNVLVLWDIDGTLLAAGQDNAPHSRAIEEVVSGTEVEEFATDGMTDAQGATLHLDRAGLDEDLLPAVLGATGHTLPRVPHVRSADSTSRGE